MNKLSKYLKSENLALSLNLLGIFFLCSIISTHIFQGVPLSMDENSMLFQARLFAEGKLYHPADIYSPYIKELYIINLDGKIVSKYPPGPAILYAIGILVGKVELVNPLISSLSCLFIFLTIKNIFSSKVAWPALAILGSSPYFYPYACSFFAQPLSLFLSSICFYLLSAHIKRPSTYKIIAMGLSVAFLFLSRQLDAFCLSVSVAAFISCCSSKSKITDVMIFLFTSGLGVVALFTYNFILSGQLGLSLIPIWSAEFKVISPAATSFFENILLVIKDYFGYLINITIPSIQPDFIAPVGFVVVSLFIFGCLLPMSPFRVALLIFISLIVLLYAFHPTRGYPVYGSRYWYCSFGAFIILVANFLGRLQIMLPKSTFAVAFCCLILFQVQSLTTELLEDKRRVDLFKAVQADIENSCPENSIVLAKQVRYLDIDGIKFFQPMDLARNPLPLGSRIYVRSAYNANKLKEIFPEYNICIYNFRDGDLHNSLPNFP